jgi:hypothetical protein
MVCCVVKPTLVDYLPCRLLQRGNVWLGPGFQRKDRLGQSERVSGPDHRRQCFFPRRPVHGLGAKRPDPLPPREPQRGFDRLLIGELARRTGVVIGNAGSA